MTKKEIKVAVVTTVISVSGTAIYDFIKEKPVFSSLWNSVKWIWTTVFEFELKLWYFLLGLVIFVTIKRTIKSKKIDTVIIPSEEMIDWLMYKEDTIDSIKWKWDWIKNPVDGNWNAKNIQPICNKCQTKMHLSKGVWYDLNSECPRCDNQYRNLKGIEKIESIIIDNVQRGFYKSKI